jgi:hypothetical protein
MAKIKITLNNDHLLLISNIHFEEVPSLRTETKTKLTWGIDFFNLYGGNFLFEDVSHILGRYNEHIEGTEDDCMGPRFNKDFEDYMVELHDYIVENIEYIEELIHYFSNKGGLIEGTYIRGSDNALWKRLN